MTDAKGRYLKAARGSAAAIMARYSTSFGLAARLSGRRIGGDLACLYAVVRVADEIVDGAAPEEERAALLSDYRRRALAAPREEFSPDPVLHAFGELARRCSFPAEPLEAFFSSMARDLDPAPLAEGELEDYVYGSAEAVGLLCLAVFFEGPPNDHELEADARRLGRALQYVNFVRDLGVDERELGRSYLGALTDSDKDRLLAEATGDLEAARRAAARLPRRARVGVRVAAGLYEELAGRLSRLSVAEIAARRVSVPASVKARIAAREAWLSRVAP